MNDLPMHRVPHCPHRHQTRKGPPEAGRFCLRASFGITIHQANDPCFGFALFPRSAVNRHHKVRQQRRGLSPDGPMEVFRAIIVIGVKGARQGFPLRWIGCFDYRLDSVDQLVHSSKWFFAHFGFFPLGVHLFVEQALMRLSRARLGRPCHPFPLCRPSDPFRPGHLALPQDQQLLGGQQLQADQRAQGGPEGLRCTQQG